jgi:malate dehydrogenase
MAHAGAKFAASILNATVKGEAGIIEPSYVHLDADKEGGTQVRNSVDGLDYFSSKIELGRDGVAKIYPLNDLNGYEKKLLEKAIPDLKTNINKGVSFINESKF